MATDDSTKLSKEEIRQLLGLDLQDTRARIEHLVSVLDHSKGELDAVSRIGSLVFGLSMFVPVGEHVLLAAVAIDMLNDEREKNS